MSSSLTQTGKPPTIGSLVGVRGRTWVVGDVDAAPNSTLVTLQSVEDGEYGRTLDVIWEVEPGRPILPSGSLPDVATDGFDPPERLAAFLDAVRWSAVTSADTKTLQSPFRAGVAIEDYQLEPVSRAVGAPRVNLLLADDVDSARPSRPGFGHIREQLRRAFQAEPTEHPVRILLATDAASEGIDLQNHCHRLVDYDIPFNPNRLEQRIGRVDRYGQTEPPDIRHFVGTGWDKAVDSFEADLEFLSRVAIKVARMEADMGPVNAVLPEAVQRRMLGENVDVDVVTKKATAPPVPVETDVRRQVVRLREVLDKTVEDLGITPPAIRRVVSTALELASQLPLRAHLDERRADERLLDVPTLTGSWERAAAGLTEKLERPDYTPRQLPITFDPDAARGRDDVV